MPKTYPSNWTTREVAFFAGIISASIRIGDLCQIVDQCRTGQEDHQLYFGDLVQRLEPQISADRWAGCIENCQRLFRVEVSSV